MRTWVLLAACAPAACSCTTVRRMSGHAKETVAIAVKVSDAESGEPVKDVQVNFRVGKVGSEGGGLTDAKGEYSFMRSYYARGLSDRGCPRYFIIDLWKEGYRWLMVYVKGEDYVHGATEARLFKDLELEMRRGRGRDTLDLTKGAKEEAGE